MSKLSRKKSRKATIFDPALMRAAFKQSFLMLNPLKMARNPVMFVTEIGAALTTLVWFLRITDFYTCAVTVILWLTVLFANFAEALAEARGKAQADSLKDSRRATPTRLFAESGEIRNIGSD